MMSNQGPGPYNPETDAGPVPTQSGTTRQPSAPIGVPYYDIDPRTGLPKMDRKGNPVRWGSPREINLDTALSIIGGGATQYDTNPTVLPRYFDGAQWLPGSLPPDQMVALQKQMIKAGLLKQGQAAMGVWDATSMNAYTQLLAFANSSGLDVGTALDRWSSAGKTSNNAPLQVKLSNPEDLKPAFQSALMKATGQAWSSEQIDAMVAAYQQTERAAQEQNYAQQDTGGTVVQPPSATSFATAQAKEQDPGAVEAHDALGYENKFFSMLKGVV